MDAERKERLAAERAELREVIKNARKVFHEGDAGSSANAVKAKKNLNFNRNQTGKSAASNGVGDVITGGSNPSTGRLGNKNSKDASTPGKQRQAYHLASPGSSACSRSSSSSNKGSASFLSPHRGICCDGRHGHHHSHDHGAYVSSSPGIDIARKTSGEYVRNEVLTEIDRRKKARSIGREDPPRDVSQPRYLDHTEASSRARRHHASPERQQQFKPYPRSYRIPELDAKSNIYGHTESTRKKVVSKSSVPSTPDMKNNNRTPDIKRRGGGGSSNPGSAKRSLARTPMAHLHERLEDALDMVGGLPKNTAPPKSPPIKSKGYYRIPEPDESGDESPFQGEPVDSDGNGTRETNVRSQLAPASSILPRNIAWATSSSTPTRHISKGGATKTAHIMEEHGTPYVRADAYPTTVNHPSTPLKSRSPMSHTKAGKRVPKNGAGSPPSERKTPAIGSEEWALVGELAKYLGVEKKIEQQNFRVLREMRILNRIYVGTN